MRSLTARKLVECDRACKPLKFCYPVGLRRVAVKPIAVGHSRSSLIYRRNWRSLPIQLKLSPALLQSCYQVSLGYRLGNAIERDALGNDAHVFPIRSRQKKAPLVDKSEPERIQPANGVAYPVW